MIKHTGTDKIHAALKKLKDESTAKEMELIELVSSIYETVKEKKDMAVEKVKDTASTVNTSVHLYPWRFIGGGALLGFIIGRFLRRH
jgi:ElaB/YqjD/DUF883 family membrane-anchored ribosome-binding protein